MNVLIIFTYPGVESYLTSLISSINQQTNRDFSVFFVNDGLANLDNYVFKLDVSSKIIDVSGTPYKNRILGLKKLQELEIQNIIFQDADDLMASNRIDECLKYLDTNSFVVNDLDLINSEGEVIKEKYWSERLSHGHVFFHDFIKDFNLLGFTNTAMQGELLQYLPEFQSEEIVAADWFIFYRILYESRVGVRFITSTTSLYRQHAQNVTGIGALTESRLEKALEVKRKHYLALVNAGFDMDNELTKILQLRKNTKHKFKKKNNPHLFWWEETECIYEEN